MLSYVIYCRYSLSFLYFTQGPWIVVTTTIWRGKSADELKPRNPDGWYLTENRPRENIYRKSAIRIKGFLVCFKIRNLGFSGSFISVGYQFSGFSVLSSILPRTFFNRRALLYNLRTLALLCTLQSTDLARNNPGTLPGTIHGPC